MNGYRVLITGSVRKDGGQIIAAMLIQHKQRLIENRSDSNFGFMNDISN